MSSLEDSNAASSSGTRCGPWTIWRHGATERMRKEIRRATARFWWPWFKTSAPTRTSRNREQMEPKTRRPARCARKSGSQRKHLPRKRPAQRPVPRTLPRSRNSWSGNALKARSKTEVPKKGPPCLKKIFRPVSPFAESIVKQLPTILAGYLKVVAEVFNPGCIECAAHKHGLNHGLAFDLQLRDDLLDDRRQAEVRQYIQVANYPGVTLISPPCETHSQLHNLVKELRNRKPERMEKYLKKKRVADRFLHFAIDIALRCIEFNLYCLCWNIHGQFHHGKLSTWEGSYNWRVSSWVDVINVWPACSPRIVHYIEKERVLPPTTRQLPRHWTSNIIQCDKNHQHEHIIGGHRSKVAQVYTQNPKVKERIIKAYN